MIVEIEKYRKKFSIAWKYSFRNSNTKYNCAIVIPACAESEYLPATLDSVRQNASAFLSKTCLIIVVNRPRNSQNNNEFATDNSKTIQWITENKISNELNLFLVSDKNGNYDLPLDGGVGEARKIGMDIALEILENDANSFICSLDADTAIEKDYLDELFLFFSTKKADVAIPGYSHRQDGGKDLKIAIEIYEKYLKSYVDGLKYAESPYAFHTIGSAMAFTARAYIKAGGMKIKKGGEDFYFLEALVKTSSVAEIKKILVHPSARLSNRVPFGTGPSLKKILAGEHKKEYSISIFNPLKNLLTYVKELCENRNSETNEWLQKLDKTTKEFLEKNHFEALWPKIVMNCPDSPEKRLKAFHNWFDAFRTLKFIHFCEKKVG